MDIPHATQSNILTPHKKNTQNRRRRVSVREKKEVTGKKRDAGFET